MFSLFERWDEIRNRGDRGNRTLEAMDSVGVNSNLSVKMTQLGLDIDRNFCVQNMCLILETAKNTTIL